MVRQRLNIDPAQKLLEVYPDFSGGLDTDTSNERLRDNEFPVMENVNLAGRGSAKRRTGRVEALTSFPDGTGQGIFFYYRRNQPAPDIIMAVSGKLYNFPPTPWSVTDEVASGVIDGSNREFTVVNPFLQKDSVTVKLDDNVQPDDAYTVDYKTGTITLDRAPGGDVSAVKVSYNYEIKEMSITSLSAGFQTTLPIEAVQYKDLLFIATGTKLIEYDGTEVKVVTPYQPTAMEAIYIGTNGLADDPDSYIQDGVSEELIVAGIKPSMRSGVTNQVATMTAYISKPETMTVQYKWEYHKVNEETWVLGQDFADNAKTWDFKPESTGNYEIRVTARDKASTSTTADFTITNYPVYDVADALNETLPVSSIQTCRKIMLHWDRILLAKDNEYPHQMYISHLNNPRYFPTTNSINFDANKQEPITAIVRYRDMLVVFTKTTIQTLLGKSPIDYRRALIHDGIGCIADRSAQVVGNHILFLSNEGIQMLAPSVSPFTLDTLNVKRVDIPIKSQIHLDTDAAGIYYDNQYWISFPSRSVLYRFYYDTGVWVRDKSSNLNLVQFDKHEVSVYEQTKDGKLYKQDSSVYNDAGDVYSMVVESKYHDLSALLHQKKLKRLYVLGSHYEETVNMKVYVYADAAIALTPDVGEAVIGPGHAVTWETKSEPNMQFYAGTVVGSWLLGKSPLGDAVISVQRALIQTQGKCRRVKIRFEHTEDSPCEIYSYAFEFKPKKI